MIQIDCRIPQSVIKTMVESEKNNGFVFKSVGFPLNELKIKIYNKYSVRKIILKVKSFRCLFRARRMAINIPSCR